MSSKALPKFLAALTQSRCARARRPRPRHRHQRRLLRRTPRLQDLFVEDLSADIEPPPEGRDHGGAARRRSRSDSATPTRAWTACCAGTIFDFLDKASAQALARQARRACCARAARCIGFFCTSSVPTHRLHQVPIVDDASLRHRPYPGPRVARNARCRTATSSGCSTG